MHLGAELAVLLLRHRAHLLASLVSSPPSKELIDKFLDTDTMVMVSYMPTSLLHSGEWLSLVTTCFPLAVVKGLLIPFLNDFTQRRARVPRSSYPSSLC